MKCICKQCGKEFELSEAEISFYRKKNLHLPKRCKECRQENKQKQSGRMQGGRLREGGTLNTQPSYQGMPNQPDKRSRKWIYAWVALVVLLFAGGIGAWKLHRIFAELDAMIVSVSVDAPYSDRNQSADTADMEEPPITDAADAGQSPNIDAAEPDASGETAAKQYTFRNADLLEDHFQKHGVEMGFATAQDYQAAASAVVNHKNALHKLEAEDGDDVYYLEESNEFVIVSTDGFIRTYFCPEAGIAYYHKQ